MLRETKSRSAGKKIIFVFVFVLCTDAIFAQTMVIKKTDNSTVQILTQHITEITFIGLPCPGTETVDYDGITYNTVQIGTQCWLKENLDIGTRIDGILEQTNNGGTNIIEKYCYGNSDANCVTYGGLYQWNEAMQYVTTGGAQGICPPGWHIPTLTEFTTLQTTVGGSTFGNALKAFGQGGAGGSGTNISGFSALLAGYRSDNGGFSSLGSNTVFWSSTEVNATFAYGLVLYEIDSNIYLNNRFKDFGYSVRCLKD